MHATKNNKDLFKFFQKTKNSFINVCKNEVGVLKSVKIQLSLLVKFHMTRTHIYNGGFVTDFFGALFYPSAHNVRRRGKIEPRKNR